VGGCPTSALDLLGYPGGQDVVGNWVNEQFQLDAFGEALLLFAAAPDHDYLDAEGWQAAETAAEVIAKRWQEPDAGVWEIDPRRLDAQPADLRRRAPCDQPT
jgi:alpha,alpha-trehalase